MSRDDGEKRLRDAAANVRPEIREALSALAQFADAFVSPTGCNMFAIIFDVEHGYAVEDVTDRDRPRRQQVARMLRMWADRIERGEGWGG